MRTRKRSRCSASEGKGVAAPAITVTPVAAASAAAVAAAGAAAGADAETKTADRTVKKPRSDASAVSGAGLAVPTGPPSPDAPVLDTLHLTAIDMFKCDNMYGRAYFLKRQGDTIGAIKLYYEAAQHGHVSSCLEYARTFQSPDSWTTAAHWYQRAVACAPDTDVRQWVLGTQFRELADLHNRNGDSAGAAHWLREGAVHGIWRCQLRYGRCLLYGVGVARDVRAAASMFRSVLRQQRSQAALELGILTSVSSLPLLHPLLALFLCIT